LVQPILLTLYLYRSEGKGNPRGRPDLIRIYRGQERKKAPRRRAGLSGYVVMGVNRKREREWEVSRREKRRGEGLCKYQQQRKRELVIHVSTKEEDNRYHTILRMSRFFKKNRRKRNKCGTGGRGGREKRGGPRMSKNTNTSC